jgi:protein TilB
MPEITLRLIRKRAEHNEGIITSLEELSLHQEEIESINEVLGSSCRKLKILYLQNNIIGKIENLHHMKELRYLNLALNNITRIEGLHNCEFLHKLDLTLNFIDYDTFQYSMENLSKNRLLEELFLVGNPVQAKWEKRKYESYIIAKVPQLRYLDGMEVTKSMLLLARQSLSALEVTFCFRFVSL